MVDKPKRPILHLKFPPATPPAVPTAPVRPPPEPMRSPYMRGPSARGPSMRSAAPRAPKPPPPAWKCKPCGKAFDVVAELADDEAVRCPSCNARLGLAGDFRGPEPNLAKLRARQAASR